MISRNKQQNNIEIINRQLSLLPLHHIYIMLFKFHLCSFLFCSNAVNVVNTAQTYLKKRSQDHLYLVKAPCRCCKLGKQYFFD